jgi:uncharacterized protein (DUF849 family)
MKSPPTRRMRQGRRGYVHIHVRDENGKNSMNTDIFCDVVGKIRKAVADAGLDVVLNLTTPAAPSRRTCGSPTCLC